MTLSFLFQKIVENRFTYTHIKYIIINVNLPQFDQCKIK